MSRQKMPTELIALLEAMERFNETGQCDCPACTAERSSQELINPNPPANYEERFGFAYTMKSNGKAEIRIDMECNSENAAIILTPIMQREPRMKLIVLNAIAQL